MVHHLIQRDHLLIIIIQTETAPRFDLHLHLLLVTFTCQSKGHVNYKDLHRERATGYLHLQGKLIHVCETGQQRVMMFESSCCAS